MDDDEPEGKGNDAGEGERESGSSPSSGVRPSFMAVYPLALKKIDKVLKRYEVPPSDREDAAQEALAEMVRTIHAYDGARPIGAWLYIIARRKIRDYRDRAHHRREVAAESFEDEPGGVPDAEHAARVKQAHYLLQSFLDVMSEEQADVYWLCEICGLSSAEAAAELGINENTVRSRLAVARTKVEEGSKRRKLRGVPLIAPLDRDDARSLWDRWIAALRLAPGAFGALGALLFGAGVIAGMMWIERWASRAVMASAAEQAPRGDVEKAPVVAETTPIVSASPPRAPAPEPRPIAALEGSIPRRAPSVVVSQQALAPAPTPPPPVTEIAALPPPPPAPTVTATVAPLPAPIAVVTAAPTADAAAEEGEREKQLIRGARQALLRQDPARALELLSQHQRQFPRGAFASERERLRAQAIEMKNR